MMQFDAAVLKDLLRRRLKYAPVDADQAVMALSRTSEILQPALEHWIADGRSDEFTFESVSLNQIMIKERCDFIQALITMGVLIDHPGTARRYPSMKRLIR